MAAKRKTPSSLIMNTSQFLLFLMPPIISDYLVRPDQVLLEATLVQHFLSLNVLYYFCYTLSGILTMVHMAESEKQLDSDTETLYSIARKHLCQMATLKWQQVDGLNTVLAVWSAED